MPRLQAIVPQEIADAVEREAQSRNPKASISRVAAEAIIHVFKHRIRVRKTKPKKQ